MKLNVEINVTFDVVSSALYDVFMSMDFNVWYVCMEFKIWISLTSTGYRYQVLKQFENNFQIQPFDFAFIIGRAWFSSKLTVKKIFSRGHFIKILS